MGDLIFVPVTYHDAKRFSCENHLYLDTFPPGHVFSLGFLRRLHMVGVITWGRPTNNHLDDGYTLQGYRLATDHSVKNMGSMLIGRSLRVISLLGYHRAVAYVRADYRGCQVRACGFVRVRDRVRARDGSLLNVYTLTL